MEKIYAGTQPEGPFCVNNKLPDVVKRMAEPLFGSGRNITADNWFSDFNLIHELTTKKLLAQSEKIKGTCLFLLSMLKREHSTAVCLALMTEWFWFLRSRVKEKT
ncbi:hypothetical protein ILUMI_10103 [Ignelater luminosus]|uniref:Transposase n=1 Tax=Ignelater luminosus TaxID=2038154 RepID=A0A8K0D308_IGNLU|nr:hypothetical protein ILUMI_10103 [Ignelater luminosus]